MASRRRDVTVMFTDIVGFTPQAEDLPEQETADMLNHHFALLGACIEHDAGRDRQVYRRLRDGGVGRPLARWRTMPTMRSMPRSRWRA